MPCKKCSDLQQEKSKYGVSETTSFPSILELVYMVNLQYHFNMEHNCIHEIPEVPQNQINIKDMVDFLDQHNWEWRGRQANEGFSSAIVVNDVEKQVVVIHRGTENWQQIQADILLALNLTTPNTVKTANGHTIHALLNYATKQEKGKFVRNEYSITITGHSLGGWLAQLCTLVSKYPKFLPVGPSLGGVWHFGNGKSVDLDQSFELHCVAFDSPGASTILQRLDHIAQKTSWLVGDKYEVEKALKNLDITVFLSNPNVVNLCGTHVGRVERIDVLKHYGLLPRINPFGSHSMEKILNYFIIYEAKRVQVELFPIVEPNFTTLERQGQT